MNQIEIDAKQLLTDLDLYRVPVDPKEICRKLGIIYDERQYEQFDGILIVNGDQQLIGVNSSIQEPGRKSFTCAHEIGHYQYDILDGSFFCNRNDLGYGKDESKYKENRANQFASALLMPRELFLAEIKRKEPSWEVLKDLSRIFQTSLQATASRFITLTSHVCWLVVVKDGVIQRFTKAAHNDFVLEVKKAFNPPTADPGSFSETYAESWLYPSPKIKNKKLVFWPLPANRYGESPVLLWDKNLSLLDDNFLQDEFDEELSRRE